MYYTAPSTVKVRMLRPGAVSPNGFNLVAVKAGEETDVELLTAKGMIRDGLAEWLTPADALAQEMLETKAQIQTPIPVLGFAPGKIQGPTFNFSMKFTDQQHFFQSDMTGLVFRNALGNSFDSDVIERWVALLEVSGQKSCFQGFGR